MRLLTYMVLCLTMALASCSQESGSRGSGDAAELRKVRLLLNWFPEMEHGGFYAAAVHGYYAEAGLEVEIVPGGAGVQVIPRVATGQAEFGVANADPVIFGRAEGAAVKALMAPMQVSPRCIMLHKEAGITRFEDIRDITLAMNQNGAFAKFLMKKYPLENVKIVPYAGNVAPFLTDKAYAQQAYNISEPFVAQKNGAQTTLLLLADAGFNPYTSCVVVSEELIAKDPDMVRRFVEASLRGWERYMKDSAETNTAIQKLNPEMSFETLQWGVEQMQPMVRDAEGRIGPMVAERWEALLAQMEELDLVAPGRVKAAECFTLEFLPAAGVN